MAARLFAACAVLLCCILAVRRAFAPVAEYLSCEEHGGFTVSAPGSESSDKIGSELGACLHRSFDGTYVFFTFSPTIDRFVSNPMLRDGGLYDHMVHAALEDTIARSERCNADGAVVVDVGANLGTLTLFASSRACAVVSFELQDRVARVLQASIHVNLFQNAVVRRQPVSDVAGQFATFSDSSINPGGVAMTITTANASRTGITVTLDGEFPAPTLIRFLKIDTEGHELPVLRGARSLFEEHRVEAVVLELRAGQAVEAAEFLYSKGYTCRIPTSGTNEGRALYAFETVFPPGPPRSKSAFIEKVSGQPLDLFSNPYCRWSW
jgi:FkbM family methyltransferase